MSVSSLSKFTVSKVSDPIVVAGLLMPKLNILPVSFEKLLHSTPEVN